MSKKLAPWIVLIATLVWFAPEAKAEENPEEPPPTIIVVAEDKQSGLRVAAPQSGRSETDLSTLSTVSYTTGSTLRFFDELFATDNLDTQSFTSCFPTDGSPAIETKTVVAIIKKDDIQVDSNLGTELFQGTITRDTLNIDIPGLFQGEGEHRCSNFTGQTFEFPKTITQSAQF